MSVYNSEERDFEFKPGPVFANIVVGDEINRASPKTQAALLECMEERQVTVDGVTYGLEAPFMVLATQNPVDMEGTYPLPEAQRDRFTARISMGYPDRTAEIAMLAEHAAIDPLDTLQPVSDATEIRALIAAVRAVYVSDAIKAYAVDLAEATRQAVEIRLGASPRATLQLLRAAKAWAALGGREYVIPDDLQYLLSSGARATGCCSPPRRTSPGAPRRTCSPGSRKRLRSRPAPGTAAEPWPAASGSPPGPAACSRPARRPILCGVLFGEVDLTRAGILALVIPCVAALLVHRSHVQIANRRRVEPTETHAGQAVTIHLTITNRSVLPTGALMLEDRLPDAVPGRARFVARPAERPRGATGVLPHPGPGSWALPRRAAAHRLVRPVPDDRPDPVVHGDERVRRSPRWSTCCPRSSRRARTTSATTSAATRSAATAPTTSRRASTGPAMTCARSTGGRRRVPAR